MNSIEYKEEDVKEKIGEYDLDSNLDRYTDQDIKKILQEKGIAFQENNEYEIIPGNGEESARVILYQNVKREVPYKVEKTLIGNFPLDSKFQTDKSQKDRAYALMHIAGLDVEDQTKYEVEARKDEMGRTTSYVVYQVTKTPFQENKNISNDSSVLERKIESIEDARQYLDTLKSIRASLNHISSEVERKKTIDALTNGVERLEERINHPVSILKDSPFLEKMKNVKVGVEAFTTGLKSMIDDVSKQNNSHKEEVSAPIPTKMADLLKNEIQAIDYQINHLEKEVRELLDQYQKSENKVEKVEKEDTLKNEENFLSEEEERKKQADKMMKLVDENNSSSYILRLLDANKKQVSNLKKEKNAKQADLKRAEALDLTVEEYMEIQNVYGRKKIEEAIMDRKGLLDIYQKNASERTAEEKELLNQVKNEVFKEIHEKRKEESLSVFDTVQLLYHLDLTLSQGENPKVLKVAKKEMEKMGESASHSPEKIVDHGLKDHDIDYVPDSVPEDMKDTVKGGFIETIVLFQDIKTGDIYIREYGLERFNLLPIGPSVMINGAVCYPISEENAQRIIAKKDNDYSPYRVVNRGIDSKEIENLGQKDSLDSVVYIKKLLQYVKEHDTSIYRYYVDLAKQYHDNKDNLDFKPEEFEQHNPFLKDEDYQVLRDSDDKRMSQYFASAMRRVIDFHLAEYLDGKELEKDENKDNDYSQEDIHQYIKELSNYTLKNNINIHNYYENLAKKYREDDKFEPEEFEKNNPFMNEEVYQNLINGDDSVTSDFANKMSQLVQNQQGTKEDSKEERIPVYVDFDNENAKYLQEKVISNYKIDPISGEYLIEGENTYRVSEEDYGMLKNKLEEEKRSFEEKSVHLGRQRGSDERIVFYQNEDQHQDIYASKYVITRFHIEPTSEEREIEGKRCFRISDEDAQYIIEHQDNQYSPYEVDVRSVHLGLEDSLEEENNKELVLYRDLDDNSQVYSSEDVLNYFHMVPEGEATPIEGKSYYKINHDEENEMLRRANSSNDPKVNIQYHDTHLKDEEEEKEEEEEEEFIPLFRDVDHDNRIYASPIVLERFGLEPEGELRKIKAFECYPVSPEQLSIIEDKVQNSKNPKLAIQYIDVHLQKNHQDVPTSNSDQEVEEAEIESPRRGEIHYQTVIKKLTDGLDHLGAREAKRYRASNISVRSAAKEIRTGNWLYNVFGTIPGIVRMPFLWFKKIGAKLLLNLEAKKDYEELQRRLNEDLTEEELEVLFRKYRGSNALADMNPSINSMISDRMHRYVLEKVDKLNDVIKVQYAQFFSYLDEILVLEKELEKENLSEEEKETFLSRRKELMGLAADCARNISNNRDEGIQLLSGGGLHAFEEDMKAVDSKMNYVGYRFAKAGKFDHETQDLLAQFGQGFNDALANADDEGIVQNFLCYEACYYDNTEIRNSIFGKRSTGTKYYSPLIEEMNYQDDPFIRNLLSTVAIVSSAVSAVNAYRVHKIESDRILEEQRQQARSVNAYNDTVVDQAHQVGQRIEGHRQEVIDGMESQIHHSVDETALGLERSALDGNADSIGWNLGGNYTSVDQANHVFYNNFHNDVSSRINDVAARYGTGSIDQMQALREMATIANDSQTTLNTVVNDCLTTLRDYAQIHPEFDLDAIEESMSYIVSNPDAIIRMNDAAVDIMEQAGTLSGLSAAHMTALSSLPSDMLTTLISAATGATLAYNVSSTMSQKYGKKGQYGNEVTNMMEDFLSRADEEENVSEEEEEHHHTR